MSEQKPICIICNGKYPFASETAFGLRPNHFKKDMPDVFICWECVHWLQEEFNKHIHNFSYSLLFTHPKKADSILKNECDKDIWQDIYNEEIRDFDNDHKFECPHCGAKLLVGMTWEYFAEEDSTIEKEKVKKT